MLHTFTGGADGAHPYAGMVRDSAGNLYGTTSGGGVQGYGVVFKLDEAGAETVLYSFTYGADGEFPYAALVRDPTGNLYGTTYYGGAFDAGVVFKLDTDGNETVLYSFTGAADGEFPYAGLVRDSTGNLFGTTEFGGTYGHGVVFKVGATGSETVLHNFKGADGKWPFAGLVRDSVGNLYGTTFYGGLYHHGVVFKITPD